jgi:hypothetical protein
MELLLYRHNGLNEVEIGRSREIYTTRRSGEKATSGEDGKRQEINSALREIEIALTEYKLYSKTLNPFSPVHERLTQRTLMSKNSAGSSQSKPIG